MFYRRHLFSSVGIAAAAGVLLATASAATAAGPVVLTAAPLASAPSGTTPSADRLPAGARLVSGADVVSPNGAYRLTMRADGSAALLDSAGTPLWRTKAVGSGASLVLRADGKAVLTTATGAGAWYAPPAVAGAELVVLDSGQVGVFAGAKAVWWSAVGGSTKVADVVQTGAAPTLPAATAPGEGGDGHTDGAATTRDAAQHPFAATSPWNTPIGSGATFEAVNGPRTASLLAGGKPVVNRDQWSVAVSIARASDPVATLVGVRNKVSYQAVVPTSTTATGGTDRHVTIVQPDRRTAYDVYKWETYTGGIATTQIAVPVDLTGSGIGSGGRAAAVPSIAGLIRAQELENLSIEHALALAVPGTVLKSGQVWPATRQDSDAATSYSGAVPMGALFAIPGSVDVTRLGLSKEGLALARALQDYGTYIVDRSGTNSLYCELSCDTARYEALRVAWRELHPLLRAVTNNTAATVGGGGQPRVAPAAGLG